MNWISVEDSLPVSILLDGEEVYPYVVAYSRWGDPPFLIASYDHEASAWYGSYSNIKIDGVTHWSPLDPPSA